eukprot:5235943-Pleurochrysis_carterae.AAC.1
MSERAKREERRESHHARPLLPGMRSPALETTLSLWGSACLPSVTVICPPPRAPAPSFIVQPYPTLSAKPRTL